MSRAVILLRVAGLVKGAYNFESVSRSECIRIIKCTDILHVRNVYFEYEVCTCKV